MKNFMGTFQVSLKPLDFRSISSLESFMVSRGLSIMRTGASLSNGCTLDNSSRNDQAESSEIPRRISDSEKIREAFCKNNETSQCFFSYFYIEGMNDIEMREIGIVRGGIVYYYISGIYISMIHKIQLFHSLK